ncbi:N-acetylmuramoyl-L-alanine amidase [Halobacillus sp. Marseille-Q1614]|uniref:N-acetylmuramoyl-L-alanine amidase family protein n=1 Tax=Halobacillus sp. Marseille-Q1614 TaxID=2709134 RepID=UPI001570375A|nr:N-acetylmuramoyl-L-alanine amidase [Halobacillus sp. Marseille-Q1614]
MSKKIFALDPGHGGKDPGATGSGIKEKDIVLDICRRVQKYIAEHYAGIDCRLTRPADSFISLTDRTKKANQWNADCFVSVHVNSASSRAANGFESYIYTTDGKTTKSYALQQKLHPALAELWTEKGRKDRGRKKENFAVIREFKGASVLVELGFIVNQQDNKLLRDETFLQTNAEALADAVASYLDADKSKNKSKAAIYRVKVNGRQVGAYAEAENVGRAVMKAINSGESVINVELIQ